jgi:hypothetical protein
VTVKVSRGRARAVIEPTIYGQYDDLDINNLRAAVVAVCRAVDTNAARRLADDLAPKASR